MLSLALERKRNPPNKQWLGQISHMRKGDTDLGNPAIDGKRVRWVLCVLTQIVESSGRSEVCQWG